MVKILQKSSPEPVDFLRQGQTKETASSTSVLLCDMEGSQPQQVKVS